LYQSSLNFLLPVVTEVHDEDEFSANTLADLLTDAQFILALPKSLPNDDYSFCSCDGTLKNVLIALVSNVVHVFFLHVSFFHPYSL
jgi:hypothetical protein